MGSVATDQEAFRGRGDTVGLETNTFDHNLNTNFTQAVNAVFRVRFVIAETNGGAQKKAYKWQFNLAGAGFVDVTSTSALQWALSSQYADQDTTGQLIGSGTNVAGEGSEGDNIVPDSGVFEISNPQEVEIEGAFSIDSAQVSDLQTIVLRTVESDGTQLDAYTADLTITVDDPSVGATVPIMQHHRQQVAAA